MIRNPLPWPSFEQLGRDLYDNVSPALDQLARGDGEVNGKAKHQIDRLQTWLDSPCVVSVKLDGTNVGIDEKGMLVGRNAVVKVGEAWQKVDVWTLLNGCGEKVAALKTTFESASGGHGLEQVMAYGELTHLNKFDYQDAGLFKSWLCFGAVIRPRDADGPDRLTAALRDAGFNASPKDGCVLVSLSEHLAKALSEVGIRSVADCGYVPRGAGSPSEWAQHEGSTALPAFTSMRRLIFSDWARRLLVSSDGYPLAEGLVVASAADGRLFKWKTAAEEMGKVPDHLKEAVDRLRKLNGHSALPADLLQVFEVLNLVATTKHVASTEGNSSKGKSDKVAVREDPAAIAVFESTLTKFDALEEVFARGDPSEKGKNA